MIFRRALWIGLIPIAAFSHADVVYDNITGQSFQYYFAQPSGADDVTLAGSARTVTSVDADIVAFPSYTGTLRIDLYNIVGSGLTWTVGSLIGSGSLPVSFDGITNHYNESVPIANITVPDHFVIAFEVVNGPMGVGISVGNNPVVGSSADRVASNGPNWSYINGPDPSGTLYNFAYRVNAVPEPASMAVLGLGVMALSRRRSTKARA